ncbi:MAG: hypothetical protein ABSA51_07290 [Anaerolineaceae bacterium]|jgi:hypothetical protein
MEHTAFIGVDLVADRRHFTLAALDADLQVLALAPGRMEEVLAFAAGQGTAVIGINAPSRPKAGAAKKRRSGKPDGEGYYQPRLAEFEMRQQGMPVRTLRASEGKSPLWMRKGFYLYERMVELGYAFYPSDDSPRQFFETQAEACFFNWIGAQLFHFGTLESRLQLQLALHQLGLHVPDPMIFFEEVTSHRLLHGILPLEKIHSAAELNALAAAYTACLAITQPQQVLVLGSREEGQVVVPARKEEQTL